MDWLNCCCCCCCCCCSTYSNPIRPMSKVRELNDWETVARQFLEISIELNANRIEERWISIISIHQSKPNRILLQPDIVEYVNVSSASYVHCIFYCSFGHYSSVCFAFSELHCQSSCDFRQATSNRELCQKNLRIPNSDIHNDSEWFWTIHFKVIPLFR